MNRRNWLDLSRKLVDRYDLDDTLTYIQNAFGQEALAYWGEGVLSTKTYPNPFPIVLSGTTLGGTLGPGIAYDPNGQLIQNTSVLSFSLPTADLTNPTWSILVLRYKMTGDTPIPKPSDPITTVNLNLHDDFDVVVIPGSPAVTPVYPAKQTNDVLIAGFQVPANATLGTQVILDQTIQENGSVPANRVELDPSNLQLTRQPNIQLDLEAIDQFLLLGALTLSSDNSIHDNAFITCNSGGVVGDSITLAGVTFTVGTNPALGQIPAQSSAQLLGYALARAIREYPSFSNVYTATAANGNLALYAIQPGPVGGALSVQGSTFSISGPALSGNGPRKILTVPGIAAQLDLADFYMNSLVPPSTVIFKAGSTIPAGWLYCDGSAVDRVLFGKLFNEIGTTFGAGDGVSTFNIPDCRGRSPLGEGMGSGLSLRSLGDLVGEERHILSVSEVPGHTHNWGNNTGPVSNDHSHFYTAQNQQAFNGEGFSGSGFTSNSGIGSFTAFSSGITSNHTHFVSGTTDGGSGGGQGHNTLHPSIVLKAFIKF
jgi:microcystin-dependent protein